MTGPVRVGPDWLALREPADALARAEELVEELLPNLPRDRPVAVHDLGSGTGSMARWLAPRLPGQQHWFLHDRDADLLRRAAMGPSVAASDGSPVTVRTRVGDVTELAALRGAGLVTASALLDMLTAAELDRLLDLAVAASCPVLCTLTVVGRVELDPAHALDDAVEDAFNAHQRRPRGTARLLGPDSFGYAVDGLSRRGLEVLVRPSPWRLGPDQAPLIREWFTGWVGAAVEQRPERAGELGRYAEQRLAEAARGRLSVTVHHRDLLAVPA